MLLTPVRLSTHQALACPALPALIGIALVAVLAAGVALGPHARAAAPCHVPGDYATIQAAVADATCATIEVAAGRYTENIRITRHVTIRGAGQGHTILDGGGLGAVVTIASGAMVTIREVTIQGGAAEFGGGLVNSGTLILEKSTVTANTTEVRGGGIDNGGTLTVRNSTVSDNTTGDGGGGLVNLGTLTVRNSTVSDNTAVLGGGLFNVGTVTLTRVTFQNNTPDDCVDSGPDTWCP